MMTVPSQMSLRRIPEAMHLRVSVAQAAAWDALIDTYTRQAVQFVTEFASRVPALGGLQLFFQVTPVPAAMQEVVRARALTGLELDKLSEPVEPPVLAGWHRLRLDLQLEHQRYRRRQLERTQELARLAGARAAEAVVATHVENALELGWLLREIMPVGSAADHYILQFGLAAGVAQMVSQRVAAKVAGDELTAPWVEPLPPMPVEEPLGEASTLGAPATGQASRA
jgi:hypothetical protein